ncbi:M28 family peptidase [Vibrio sp. WXL103]|uniref:M28 family peptidase n=1 Tax=Vibrio sp. WXL103 TaxID=3450710 RepID=UPI003EC6FAFD
MKLNKMLLVSSLLVGFNGAVCAEDSGSMADSPEALIQLLSEAAFVPTEEYKLRYQDALESASFVVPQRSLPQVLDESTDPRNTITAQEIEGYADELIDFAKQSRDDGEILWGRIQGTKYERMALDWAEDKLNKFGFEHIYHDKFPSGQAQWRPTKNDLKVVSAASIEEGSTYTVRSAITAFESGLTAEQGIEGEAIYVGDGTRSELQGRDLQDKVVLLRARVSPGALMNTARVAFARISSGEWGTPAGVVVWFDIPDADQIAGRVGAPGGGDSIGRAMPWTGVNYEDGVYLRKLIDRATPEEPVKLHLNVQGVMDPPEQRMTGNVYGVLPGKSGKYIIVISHLDGYFYGLLDNAGAVGKNMALARHYINRDPETLEHGVIFMFHGDHEVPGLGGTRDFTKRWKERIDEDLLLVVRSEHLGFKAPMNEGIISSASNATMPLMLTLTNQSPLLMEIIDQAQYNYNLPSGDRAVADPSIDEMAFYPPHYYPPEGKPMPISVGYVQTGLQYHTTADVDADMISFDALEKYTRAHAFIIDELFNYTEADLRENDVPYAAENNIYTSDMSILTLGDW